MTIDLATLPLYIDGSDGSLWLARDAWELILSGDGNLLAETRFVRVSELLALLTQSGIKLLPPTADNQI